MSNDGMIPNLTASANVNAYRMVKVSGVRTGAQAAVNTDLVVGVSDGSINLFDGTYNAPTGAPINLFPSWTVQVKTGAAVTAGDGLTTDTVGRAINSAGAAGAFISYVALETAGAADVLIWAYRTFGVVTTTYLVEVDHDASLDGLGTEGSPLSVVA